MRIQAPTATMLLHNAIGNMFAFGRLEHTRAGDALVMPTPVILCLEDPTQRVVLSKARNANHAFHLSEALWMLSGDNDGRKLDKYIHDFSSRFGEENGRIHGAYGYRWINHFHVAGRFSSLDQIKEVVRILKNDPTTRQAVISMWDPDVDLLAKTKDRPCNLQILFRIIDGKLDMTVTNRSNDLIWGALGANIVHMTILQEVIAALVGVPLGSYWVMTNNLHMYKIHESMASDILTEKLPGHSYSRKIVDDPTTFMEEVYAFHHQNPDYPQIGPFKNTWIPDVVGTVQATFEQGKLKQYAEARMTAASIDDDAWRQGMFGWLSSRGKTDEA